MFSNIRKYSPAILLVTFVCLLSCSSKAIASKNNSESDMRRKNDRSIEVILNQQDSTLKHHHDSLVLLDDKIYSAENNIISVKEESNRNFWLICIVGTIALIAIICNFIVYMKAEENYKKNKERVKALDEKLRKQSDASTDHTNDSSNSKYKQSTNTLSIEELERRIYKLENELKSKTIINTQAKTIQNIQLAKPTLAYFDLPIEGGNGYYFRNLIDSKSSASFEATVKDSIAEFTPIIQTGTLVSNDMIENAVTILLKGAKRNDASTYICTKPGVAQKIENKWYIKEKALVILK